MAVYKPGNEKGQPFSSVQAVALCSKHEKAAAGKLVALKQKKEVSWLSFPIGRAVLYPAQ